MIAVTPEVRHVVTQAEHDAFSVLSGDTNPLHTDPHYARRLMFGGVVTHGVHLVLRALETFAESHPGPFAWTALRARFFAATHPGEPVVISAKPASDPDRGDVALSVTDRHSRLVLRLHATRAGQALAGFDTLPSAGPDESCESHSDSAIANMAGDLPLYLDRTASARLFPRLAASVPASQLAAVLATTRLIGMRLPGRDSVFASVDLSFSNVVPPAEPTLKYATESYSAEQRFCRVVLSSPGMAGHLEAFVRPQPVSQELFSSIRDLVEPGVFSGQHALVVGGSRGLGETCAKLLAAGGAEVTLTYRSGADDAGRIVSELGDRGLAVRALRLDIDETPNELVALLKDGARITDLYYFATPQIFVENSTFSYEQFIEFANYYVAAPARLFQLLSGTLNDSALRSVWLPSSVAVETRPEDMTAYVMAKLAMESLAGDWAKKHHRIHFATPRLPRMFTDQTVSLTPVPAEQPAPILADLLQAFARQHPHP